jgi:glycosyltransferase involved in cell wall biosynthesis
MMPWLWWNWHRQTYPNRELVIIDSSDDAKTEQGEGWRRYAAEPGTPIGTKLNVALEHARGELCCFWDDDDWQHPKRIEWTVQCFGQNGLPPCVGWRPGWFVGLKERAFQMYTGTDNPAYLSATYLTELARTVRFDTERAADSRWIREFCSRHGRGRRLDSTLVHSLWLQHPLNAGKRQLNYSTPIGWLEEQIGEEGWGETTEELNQLERLIEDDKADD